MKCPHCSKEVSPSAKACPHCGETDPFWTKLMGWVLGSTFLFFAGLYLIYQISTHAPWLFFLIGAAGIFIVVVVIADFFQKLKKKWNSRMFQALAYICKIKNMMHESMLLADTVIFNKIESKQWFSGNDSPWASRFILRFDRIIFVVG